MASPCAGILKTVTTSFPGSAPGGEAGPFSLQDARHPRTTRARIALGAGARRLARSGQEIDIVDLAGREIGGAVELDRDAPPPGVQRRRPVMKPPRERNEV